jgi:CheY-like chemotaxis protein
LVQWELPKGESVATDQAGTRPRILYVEDEPGMCDLMRLILEAAGYVFLSAEDGAEGLETMRNEHPDLVLLDLRLPKMDGAEVLLRKRKEPAIQDIPVIAVTALASPFDQIMWKEQTEIEDYVTKPFMRKQLLASIEQVLAGRANKPGTRSFPGA